ncbi:MAG: methionyl-tRNA formyltransferase [Desulfobacteraceae bacterium 4572_35.1]|nr:MAG: methionyl-tRNA formyltransferase [Desulfobacteraceae bacterium 4572_35.1]
MGTPDFALATLQELIDSGINLVGVYTQPDRPKGRGKKLTPPPVKELAIQNNIPVFQPNRLRNEESVAQLAALNPDLIVVVAYGQILPKSVLDIPCYGCINVHASLLPRHRGASPINKAIIDGDEVTGVTTMMMDTGLDTGDMLVKREVKIFSEETAGHLHDRLALVGMKKEDGLIDWNLDNTTIHNLVRGLDPWPGAYTSLDGATLKIFDTRLSDEHAQPGTVIKADAEGIVVGCGKGALKINALQLPGKKRLCAADFLRGRALAVGTQL